MLTPEVYDAAEREAVSRLPNRITQAYKPVGFDHVGYPTHAQTLKEVARYINALGSVDFARLGDCITGGLSAEEMELGETVCRHACEFSLEISGERQVPAGSILTALLALRHVRLMFPDAASTAILEIGPGAGCLGAMLILAGYSYISTDVAQGFYLAQSNLLSRVGGNRFIEMAADDSDFGALGRIPKGAAFHVPWWKFASGQPHLLNLDIDCVFGAAVFCEMHQFALGYLAHQSSRWLSNSAGRGILVAFGPGEPASIPIPRMIDIIKGAGFELVHADKHGSEEQDFTEIGFAPWSMDVGYYFQLTGAKPLIDSLVTGRNRMKRAPDNMRVSLFYDRLKLLLQGSALESRDEQFLRFCTNGALTRGAEVRLATDQQHELPKLSPEPQPVKKKLLWWRQ